MTEMDQNTASTDPVPQKLKTMKVTLPKIAFNLLSVFTYVFDVVSDIILASRHFNEGNQTHFILTVFFIVVPAVVMALFSLSWYLDDSYKVSSKQWILRIIFLLLFMAPTLRNLEALYYAWKSYKSVTQKEKEVYSRRMIFENNDATLLRLFEAFMESAPQLVLQIYIFAKVQSQSPNLYTKTEIIQIVSIIISLLSMAFGITSYWTSLRQSLDEKNELNCWFSMIPTLWRVFEITSRVLALGLFASVFPYALCRLLALHFVVMFGAMLTIPTEICNTQSPRTGDSEQSQESVQRRCGPSLKRLGEILYKVILGVMFIFCYFNPVDTPTRYRKIFFYSLMFLENTPLMVLWFIYYSPDVYLKVPLMIIHFLSFPIGIGIMIMYYVWFHPTVGKFGVNSKDQQIPKDQISNGEVDVMLRNFEINPEHAA